MITFTILFPLSLLRYCSWGTVCLMLYLCFVSLYYYRKRKSKLFVLAENWHIEYLEDANFYSDISFSQFPTLNPFLGKFKPKKVKIITFIITFMIFFPPNRLHYCDLRHRVPYVVFMFCELVILQKKKSKMFVLPENWHTEYLEDADSYSEIGFLNFQS